MVKFVTALFVGFCCEGLLAFFSCLVAAVDYMSTAIDVDSIVISYTTARSKKVAKQLVGSCRERDQEPGTG